MKRMASDGGDARGSSSIQPKRKRSKVSFQPLQPLVKHAATIDFHPYSRFFCTPPSFSTTELANFLGKVAADVFRPSCNDPLVGCRLPGVVFKETCNIRSIGLKNSVLSTNSTDNANIVSPHEPQ